MRATAGAALYCGTVMGNIAGAALYCGTVLGNIAGAALYCGTVLGNIAGAAGNVLWDSIGKYSRGSVALWDSVEN